MTTFVKNPLILIIVLIFMYTGCSNVENNSVATDTHGRSDKAFALENANCKTYHDILHCPIGGTVLSVNDANDILNINGFDALGQDGILSSFTESIAWYSEAKLDLRPQGNSILKWSTVNEGVPSSSIAINQVGNSNTYEVLPSFTADANQSETYLVRIFNDSTLVDSATIAANENPSAMMQVIVCGDKNAAKLMQVIVCGDKNAAKLMQVIVCGDKHAAAMAAISKSNLPPGARAWQIAFDSTVTFTLPNSNQSQGNRIVFGENITTEQMPPHTFEGISLKSNIDNYSIINESILPKP